MQEATRTKDGRPLTKKEAYIRKYQKEHPETVKKWSHATYHKHPLKYAAMKRFNREAIRLRQISGDLFL